MKSYMQELADGKKLERLGIKTPLEKAMTLREKIHTPTMPKELLNEDASIEQIVKIAKEQFASDFKCKVSYMGSKIDVSVHHAFLESEEFNNQIHEVARDIFEKKKLGIRKSAIEDVQKQLGFVLKDNLLIDGNYPVKEKYEEKDAFCHQIAEQITPKIWNAIPDKKLESRSI